MERAIFCIWDSKVEDAVHWFFEVNPAVAMRGFTDAVNDPESNLYKHAEDFSLWHCGVAQGETRQVIELESRCLANAIDVKETF